MQPNEQMCRSARPNMQPYNKAAGPYSAYKCNRTTHCGRITRPPDPQQACSYPKKNEERNRSSENESTPESPLNLPGTISSQTNLTSHRAHSRTRKSCPPPSMHPRARCCLKPLACIRMRDRRSVGPYQRLELRLQRRHLCKMDPAIRALRVQHSVRGSS